MWEYPPPPAIARALITSRWRRWYPHWVLVGGMGQGNTGETTVLPECRSAEKPCSSSQPQVGSLSLSIAWKGGASLCQVTSELSGGGERETVSLSSGAPESRANINPSSGHDVAARLSNVERKGRFWKVNGLRVARMGGESIWGLKYIIGIYML